MDRVRSVWIMCTLVSVIVMSSHRAMGEVRYVQWDAEGNNDGTSWGDAHTDLQDALAEADEPGGLVTEIWVAQGTYKPGVSIGASFDLVDGVNVYGGFAGSEMLLTQRDWAANETILSGDLQGNDGSGPVPYEDPRYNDNSRHVVTVSEGIPETLRLDGFTIMRGYSRASDPG